MIAEQNVESVIYRDDPLPDVIIRFGIRVQIPAEGHNAGLYSVRIEYRAMPLEPEDWHYAISDRMSNGVHAGIAVTGMPLPNGGIRVIVTFPTIYPLPLSGPTDTELTKFGMILERATAGAIEVLCRGIDAFSSSQA